MANLTSALAEPSAATSVTVDVEVDVIDDRLRALTQMEHITFKNAHRDFALPGDVAAAWTALTSATFEPKRAHVLVMPEAARQLPVTSLRIERATRALALPPGLKELIVYSFADDVDAVLAAAAAQAPGLTRLAVYADDERKPRDGDDGRVEQPLPPRLPSRLDLPALKTLDVGFIVDDASGLSGCPALAAFECKTKDATALVTTLVASGAPVRALQLRGASGAVLTLPDALAALPLTSLTLFSAATLPAALARAGLRTLALHELKDRTLPDVVGAIATLEELKIGGKLNTLPASLAGCRALKKLDLTGALNDGVMISRWDDTKKLKPLPVALGQLTSLEELTLDHCGVVDVSPLGGLTRLKKLSIEWSGIADVAPLAALTNLEELSLHYADRVKTFAPLAALQKLRVLNLGNTRPKELEVLRALPALTSLNIEGIGCKRLDAVFARELTTLEADDEVQQAYAKRAALRALPPTDVLLAQLSSEDAAVVDVACAHLAQWGAANSTRDENALIALLRGELKAAKPAAADEDDDEDEDEYDEDDEDDEGDAEADEEDEEDDEEEEEKEEREVQDDEDEEAEAHGEQESGKRARAPKGALPALDAALARHKGALSPKTLVALFGALFHAVNDEDDAHAAIVVADEVTARGNDDDQVAFMSAVHAAFEYYDAGHRMWEDTVHDQLCDRVLAQFRAPALAAFLAKATDPLLFEDGLGALFAPALRGADDAVRETLTPVLKRYAAYLVRYGAREGRPATFWASLNDLPAASAALVAEVRAALDAEERARAATEELRQRLHKSVREGNLAQVLVDLEAAGGVAVDELRPYLSRYVTPTLDDDSVLRVLRLAPRDVDEVVAALAAAPQRVPGLLRAAGVAPADAQKAVLSALLYTRRQLQERMRRAETELQYLDEDGDEGNEGEGSAERTRIEGQLAALRAERATAVAGLRGLYVDVAGVDAAAAVRADVEGAVAGCRDYDTSDFLVVVDAIVDAVAADAGFALRLDQKTQTKLASTLGQIADQEDVWPRFLAWARVLPCMGFVGQPLERVLAQLLAIAIRDDDAEAVDALVRLVPAQVTWAILAYNLACLFARRGERAGTMTYTKRSIELGKPPQQFQEDDDFAAWLDDAEFKALLATVA